VHYEIDEEAKILQFDMASVRSADEVLATVMSLIAQRPELCAWDWIALGDPLPDDASHEHLAKLSAAWGPPPAVEAVTAFVTPDAFFHLWAKVMDFQFVRRKHLVVRDVAAARSLIERRRAARPQPR